MLLLRNKRKNDEGDSSEKKIRRKLNHVYFYNEVDTETVFDLKESLKEANDSVYDMIKEFGEDKVNKEVVLHICSPGGCVVSGLNAIDAIMKNEYPVRTIVEGMAASAATLLSLAGEVREIQEHSVLLFHQMRGWMMGRHDEIRDEVYNWEKFEDIILNFYSKRMGISKNKVKKLEADEKITTAEEALELGCVHKII